MSAITLEVAQAKLTAALAKYDAALGAVRVTHGDQTVQYQELEQLQKQIDYWSRMVDQLTAVAAGATRPLVSTARWTR